MIFAAGLGTRLLPLTRQRPKALVTVHGQPLLAHALQRLKNWGIQRAVVNVHHFGEQIIEFLQKHSPDGLEVHISDERQQLLNTGGGLRKAAPLLQGSSDILLWNVDVIANIDFQAFAKYHRYRHGLATLAVSQRSSSRYLYFSPEMRLGGWENTQKQIKKTFLNKHKLYPLAFSGIHLIRSELLNLLPHKNVFSIIDAYLHLGQQHPIYGWKHQPDCWVDAGKPQDLARAAMLLQQDDKLQQQTPS